MNFLSAKWWISDICIFKWLIVIIRTVKHKKHCAKIVQNASNDRQNSLRKPEVSMRSPLHHLKYKISSVLFILLMCPFVCACMCISWLYFSYFHHLQYSSGLSKSWHYCKTMLIKQMRRDGEENILPFLVLYNLVFVGFAKSN